MSQKMRWGSGIVTRMFKRTSSPQPAAEHELLDKLEARVRIVERELEAVRLEWVERITQLRRVARKLAEAASKDGPGTTNGVTDDSSATHKQQLRRRAPWLTGA